MEGSNPDAPPPERVLAPGHAFEAFEWKAVTEEGADWAMGMEITRPVVNTLGALQGGGLAGPRHVTSELQLSFLAAASVGPVRAVAHILHRGGKSAVVRVD